MKPQLRTDLRRDEGVRDVVYDDATGASLSLGYTLKGYASIGVGRNLHGPLSEAAMDFLLNEDIDSAVEDARSFSWYARLSGSRKRAIVNMIFNLGKPRFKTFVRLIECLEQEDYDQAAHEMLNSRWAQQVKRRANRLAKLMRDG